MLMYVKVNGSRGLINIGEQKTQYNERKRKKMSSKQWKQEWTFYVTSVYKLHRIALLTYDHKSYNQYPPFHSVTCPI